MYFKRSLQWRLVSIFVLITISLMVVVWVFLNTEVESLYYDNFKKDIVKGFTNYSNEKLKDIHKSDELISDLSINGNRSALIFFSLTDENKTYTVIDKKTLAIRYSSHREYNADKNKFEDEIFRSNNLISVLKGATIGDSNKSVHAGDSTFFDYARVIGLPDGEYILYFRYDSQAWQGTIIDFNNIILTGSVIAVILSLIIGFALSKTITTPIVNIMNNAQQLAAGDFDNTLEVKSNDEVGELTKNFNYMAKKLKNNLAEISSEKSKIETILNYMTDGVIAFNTRGEVIHANPAAKKMLRVTGINETFDGIFKEYEMGVTLEEMLYLGSSSGNEKNIKKDGKFIRVYFALFTDEEKKAEGVISVIQDVTEQQKLENMRKEFVANVSHELRTPITSIKSYTETILDGVLEDKETTKKFLGVVNSEADRMTRLVRDLLQLSRLDNEQMSWNMQEISFLELVKGAIEKIQIEAKNKGQLMESYVIGDIPDIIADHDRIEQVVLNLLSNALKYTPKGGKITIYIGRLINEVYMKVADTGIGIPVEDLPRIFERFYRVDKARSREMGGTGLGLSIAKEIVEAHGGTISVTSGVDSGTEITVKLPAVIES